MQPSERDAALLWDMLDAACAVQRYIQGKTLDDYQRDDQLSAAVERRIEIIGEAARKVSRECQDAHPDIPWRQIISQRHVLAHEYGAIQHERIWRVGMIHLPVLIEQLQGITGGPRND